MGAFVLVALVGGVFLLRVGSEFLPPMDDGRIMVKVRLPTGASVEETNRALAQIEAKLAGDRAIESMFSLVGGKVWGLYTYEIANEGEVDIRLVPRHQRALSTEAYIRKLRPIVGGVFFPGAKFVVAQMKVPGLRRIGEADIEVKIRGPEVDRLFALAQDTARTMSQLGHFRNVYVAMDLNKPEYQVQVDRTRATELGVSVTDVATTLRSLVGGAVATLYRDGNEYYNIRAIVPERRITSRQDISRLLLNTTNASFVRVSDVAAVVPATGPVEIARENQVKQVVVRGDADGVSVGQALAELQGALQKVETPSGYELAFGGQAQMMDEMRRSLTLILAFAVFFSFVVLAVQFNSLKLPVVILASLPACLTGLFFALWITGLPIGATVVIGILVVVAGVVNEGVLLITFAEQLVRARALTPLAAVIEAAKVRLRPRLMITLMIITGFLPLALNLEEGGDMLQPMAVARDRGPRGRDRRGAVPDAVPVCHVHSEHSLS